MAITVETEVPDWARWMAKDKNGTWHACERKPTLGVVMWHIDYYGKFIVCGRGDRSPDNSWTTELHELRRTK